MTKLFLTGATGYIGGDALHAIATAHPDYEITALVRNSAKGAQVVQNYPSIRLVYGDLDDVELLAQEARRADVVCHFAHADHVASATALTKGLAARDQTEGSGPGFLIHTSGTGILLFDDIRTGTYGEAHEKVYNDLAGVDEVTSLPDNAPHRNVDKIVLAAAAQGLRTAIVCPPTIYGQGRGPGNQRSHQVPELARTTLQRGHGVKVNAGKTFWCNVHVHDLSDLFLKLVENAAAGASLAEWPGKPDLWGEKGYFFCEAGEHVWGDVSQWVATAAYKQGLIQKDEVRSITKDEANECTPMGSALWGANSRSRALRAREALKWKPQRASLEEEIAATVEAEAKRSGVVPGHAKVAAGDTSRSAQRAKFDITTAIALPGDVGDVELNLTDEGSFVQPFPLRHEPASNQDKICMIEGVSSYGGRERENMHGVVDKTTISLV
nr:uncharacterized protein CFP56_53228 [Quercus suber]